MTALALALLLRLPAVDVTGDVPAPEVQVAAAAPMPAPAAPSVAELRRTKRLTLKFEDASLQKVLETLGAEVGLKVLLDVQFRDKNLTFNVAGETFDAALQQLLLVHGLRTVEASPRTLIVFPDNPGTQRHYQQWVGGLLPPAARRATIRQSFADRSLQKLLTTLGETAGLKVLFDDTYRDRNMNIRFDGETFEEALQQIAMTTRIFYRTIDATTIAIASDDPGTRRKYGMSLEALPSPPPELLGCGERASLPFGEEAGSAVRFGDGLAAAFVTRLAGESEAPRSLPVYKHTEARMLAGRHVVDRVVSDLDRKVYVGYRLALGVGKTGRGLVIAVERLPEESWRRLCVGCPVGGEAKLALYPEPFALGSGGSFTLDLMTMTSSSGDRTIVDEVKIEQPSRVETRRAARRFKVQWTMARSIADGFEAGVCIRDLESGEVLGGIPRFRVRPLSDSLVLTEEGRTKDGKPTNVVVRMALGEDRRSVVYAVELWEAAEMVHAEETRLPLMPF